MICCNSTDNLSQAACKFEPSGSCNFFTFLDSNSNVPAVTLWGPAQTIADTAGICITKAMNRPLAAL